MHANQFLDDYMEFVEEQESPRVFHKWAAITTLCTMAARRVYVERGHYTLYPNFYVVFVAESALCRKSTANDIGTGLIYRAYAQLRKVYLSTGLPSILAGKITPEAFFKCLSLEGMETSRSMGMSGRSRPLVVVSSELGALMSKSAIQAGLIDILTDIFDCPTEREYVTKGRGIDEVYDAWVSIFGATTPSWFTKNASAEIMNQGFIGRCILVYADTPYKRVSTARLTPEMKAARRRIVAHLCKVGLMRGKFTWYGNAEKIYDEWYETRTDIESKLSAETGYHGREHDHAIKLAMCLSMSRRFCLRIFPEDIEDALEMLAEIRATKDEVFSGMALEGEIPEIRLVEAKIKHAPDGLSRSGLVRGTYNKVEPDVLDKCLETLVMAKRIRVTEERRGKRGPKSLVYRWAVRARKKPKSGKVEETQEKGDETTKA